MEKKGPNPLPHVEVRTTAARQGVTGHGVRQVLAWGLVGAVIAFVIALVFFFSTVRP